MTDVITAPPPGWYSDPARADHQRWWTGIGWSDHVQAPAAPVVAPEPIAPEPIAPTATVAVPAPDAGGAVALSTPLPQSMTTEEQLAWHRPAEPGKSVGMSMGSLGGFDAPSRGYHTDPYREMAAPPLENPAAKSGMIISIVALFLNPLLIVGIVGIVKSAQGLRRAGQLESMRVPHSRRGMATAGVAIGLLATLFFLASAVLAYFTYVSVHSYHPETVQAAIAQDVQTQTGVGATVVCPASEPLSVGTTFECTISGVNGKAAFAEVRFVDSNGRFSVTYSPTSTGGAS
jgi:Protein of unknown function (DUF2510)/Domain of unknown function (DUF4333)